VLKLEIRIYHVQGGKFQHIGVCAYRREALGRYVALPLCELEAVEQLEQLRALEYGERPAVVEFTPSLKELEDEIRSILRDLESESGTTLVVTSNGRLREIARVIAGVPSKVRTGHLCVIECAAPGVWKIICWDSPPEMVQTAPA
jgi:hypothetical protein